MNLGWAFQRQRLDTIRTRRSRALVLPILPRCSREVCLDRIRARHAPRPARRSRAFHTDLALQRAWAFFEVLDRPDAYVVINVGQDADEVYVDVEQYIVVHLLCRLF